MIEGLQDAVVLGLGASLIMDGWAVLRRWLTGAPMLDYGWLTRWLIGLPAGRWSMSIGQGVALSALERATGWALHYAIGMVYAGIFLMIAGPGWIASPVVIPALVFGAITVLAPFLILQPALGRGLFASRTPSPGAARLQTLLTHLVFGLGLYLTALGLTIPRG